MYVDRLICIASLIVPNTFNHTTGGRLTDTANDSCRTTRYPCARFVECSVDVISISFVPWAPDRRMGRIWDELDYWIERKQRL